MIEAFRDLPTRCPTCTREMTGSAFLYHGVSLGGVHHKDVWHRLWFCPSNHLLFHDWTSERKRSTVWTLVE